MEIWNRASSGEIGPWIASKASMLPPRLWLRRAATQLARLPASRSTSAALQTKALRLQVEQLEPRLCLALTVPALSSLPGANHTIYLDFDGHTTMSTAWNSAYNKPLISSPAYSTDSNALDFNATELDAIRKAWQRVAEDFAPFQVNVTTVAPTNSGDLTRSGATDTKWGVRVVVSKDTAFNCGCGGIAYIDSFNWNSDTPAFVFTTGEKALAEAISHEVGHALGLAHDGAAGSSYYQGHGSGATSWAPIMGVGYYTNVTQWDAGAYASATNVGASANYNKGPDDLKIITSYNGFGYKADDHGDTLATATAMTTSGTSMSAAGLISRTNDVDLFRFSTAAGLVSLDVTPASLGANLDIKAEILDANGTTVATADSASSLAASLSVTLGAGTYYLRVDGTGVGTPLASSPTGYSDYGSLGAYTVAGVLSRETPTPYRSSRPTPVAPKGPRAPRTWRSPLSVPETRRAQRASIGKSRALAPRPPLPRIFMNGVFPSGTVTFQPNETSKQIVVAVRGDTTVESNETFQVTLSQPTGFTRITQATAQGTILNDDSAPVAPKFNIAATSATRSEGTGSTPTPFTFTITRTGDASKTANVYYSVAGVGTSAANFFDFQGGAPSFVNVKFAAGQTTATINVNVAADAVKENNETFRVTLQLPTNATLGVATADGTILNDDGVTAAGTLAPDLRTVLGTPAAEVLIAVADPMWYFERPGADGQDSGELPPAVETYYLVDPTDPSRVAKLATFDHEHSTSGCGCGGPCVCGLSAIMASEWDGNLTGPARERSFAQVYADLHGRSDAADSLSAICCPSTQTWIR
jgi:hypothetical protein